MKPKLIVSDLDGTLMRDDGFVSDYSKSVICRLIEKKHLFTVASARSLVSIKRLLSGLPLELPVVSYNGSVTSRVEASSYEKLKPLPQDAVKKVLEISRQHNLCPFVSTYNGQAEHRYYTKILNEGMQYVMDDLVEKNDRRLIQVEDFSAAFEESILEISIISDEVAADSVSDDIHREFRDKLSLVNFESRYSPGWFWICVAAKEANKGSAVVALGESLSIDPQEIMVFGDEANDIKMFDQTGYPIAVGNAIEDIRHRAKEIIGPNQTDSVAQYLEEKFL